MTSLETELFSKVIDLDLTKVARAAAILRKDKKEATSFIEHSLWYFIYDYMLNEKGQNIKINKCELLNAERNELIIKSDTNNLLLYLGAEANAQTNAIVLTINKLIPDYDSDEQNVITDFFYQSDIINIKNYNNFDLKATFINVGSKTHYFMLCEYENLHDDLSYFPRENELFSFLISKPKRANHFPTIDFSGSM